MRPTCRRCGCTPISTLKLGPLGLVGPDMALMPGVEVVPDVLLVLDVDDEDADELPDEEVLSRAA